MTQSGSCRARSRTQGSWLQSITSNASLSEIHFGHGWILIPLWEFVKEHLSHNHVKDGGFMMALYPPSPSLNYTLFPRVGQGQKALFRDLVTSGGKAEILRGQL